MPFRCLLRDTWGGSMTVGSTRLSLDSEGMVKGEVSEELAVIMRSVPSVWKDESEQKQAPKAIVEKASAPVETPEPEPAPKAPEHTPTITARAEVTAKDVADDVKDMMKTATSKKTRRNKRGE